MRMEFTFQVTWALLHLSAAVLAFRLAWDMAGKDRLEAKLMAAMAAAWAVMHTGSTAYHLERANALR